MSAAVIASILPAAGPLAIATNGLRLVCVVLAFAILLYWSPSLWRILRGSFVNGDRQRAGYVPLALAALLFELRWFWPGLQPLMRDRLAFVAHAGMALALLLAIYIHGSQVGTLRLRRAFLVHGGMLVLCIGASSILR